MSDDFDKEAEREKLRRQFEREEKARESTEHMSELLLKGATMTNTHCGECGDPIFRYDGQEFCPTCKRPVAETGTESGSNGEAETPEETAAAAGVEDAGEPGEVATGTRDADAELPPSSGTSDGAGEDAVPARDAGIGDTPDLDVEVPTADAREASTEASDGDADREREPATPPAPRRAGRDGELDRARASLVRTLVALADEAEAAENVARTRDLLAAAREAAEAIEAVDAAGSGR